MKNIICILLLFVCHSAFSQGTQPEVSVVSRRQIRVGEVLAVVGTTKWEFVGSNYTLPDNYTGYLVYSTSAGYITNTTSLGSSGMIYLNWFQTSNGDTKFLKRPIGFPMSYDGGSLIGAYLGSPLISAPTITSPITVDIEANKPLIVVSNLVTTITPTITATGTTGDTAINALAGRVNFAALADTVVVTNSLVTTNSVVIVTINSNDATAAGATATPTTGLLTINLDAAATAETKVSFIILNP